MATASSMMAVMAPLYAVSLGLGVEWLGILMALPGVFPVLLALPAGRWIDAFGAARWFYLGIVGMTTAPLLVVLFPGVAALALSRVSLGFFVLMFTLASQSLVAGLQNGRTHEANFAVHSTWLAAGRMVGPVVVGALIDAAGFRIAFAAVFTILVAAAMIAYLVHRAAGPQGAGRLRGNPRPPGAVRATLRSVGLQMAVLTSAGVFLALTTREAFLPVLLEQLGMSATLIGALVSLGSLSAVLTRPLMPVITKALGGTGTTLAVSMAAVSIGVGLLSVAQSVAAFAALAIVAGFGSGIAFPLSIVAVAAKVPLTHRGIALSLRLSINHSVEIFAPTLSGLVVAATSLRFGFAAAGIALGLLTLLSFSLVKRFDATAPAEAALLPGRVGQDVG